MFAYQLLIYAAGWTKPVHRGVYIDNTKMGHPFKISFDGGYKMRLPYELKSFLCPLLEKPAYEYNISCPLHFIAFSNFKQILKESGYRMIGDESILFNRDREDFVHIDAEGDKHRYLLEVMLGGFVSNGTQPFKKTKSDPEGLLVAWTFTQY